MSKIHASIASTRAWLNSQSKRIFSGTVEIQEAKVSKGAPTVHNFGPQLTVRLVRKQLRDQRKQRPIK